MKNFESENISSENTARRENKENKSNFTKIHEEDAEKVREKIKKLMEKNEEMKKKSENLSI